MNAPTAMPEAPTRVPFVRLDNGDQELMDELLATVADVANRGAFTLGAPVEQFGVRTDGGDRRAQLV